MGSPGNIRACIGDSLTVNGIGSQLADHFDWVVNTTAQGGNTTSDQSPGCFLFSPANGDIYTQWTGTNDKIIGKSNANEQSAFQSGHLAEMLHLGTPEGSNKVRAQSMASTGTWVNNTGVSVDSKGRTSTTNNSTLSCTVTGTSVAFVGQWNGAQTGQFSISIDGVSKGTFNATPPGGTVPSNVGNNFGPFALVFSGLSNASHTVLITVTSATGASNVVYVDFVAGYIATTNTSFPIVVVGNTHDFTSAGNTAQGTTTAENTTFKGLIASNVTTAQGLGLNVSMVDVDSLVGNSSFIGPDGVHLTQAGYILVTDAFATAIG